MAGSLGLAAYRALVRRSETPTSEAHPPRPEGEVLWIHAGEPGNILAVQDLAARLIRTRPGLQVLITYPPEATPPTLTRADLPLTLTPAPSEHENSIASFLKHWRPGAAIWVWGGLRPSLILAAAALQDCPFIAIAIATQFSDGFNVVFLVAKQQVQLVEFLRSDKILHLAKAGLECIA